MPAAIAARIARDSYGRLLAYVAGRTRDIAAAEDALAEAFAKALETWPDVGVPDNPEAWLVTTARRKLIDRGRRDRSAEKVFDALVSRPDAGVSGPDDVPAEVPDERLAMLFLCAHPAIDRTLHTPLMLQCVLGLDARRIGSAFLVAPATMGQRLSRAKAKIRDAGIAFELPEGERLKERLGPVRDAIYAAYTAGWDEIDRDAVPGADRPTGELTTEAIHLARLVVGLKSSEADPESLGLLSLLLHCEARRLARRDEAGRYVPLDDQDPDRWDHATIDEAERILKTAMGHARPGRYQLEAVIQSVHAARRAGGPPDTAGLVAAYDMLLAVAPSTGARLGRIAAIARHAGPERAFKELKTLDGDRLKNHQPYWALRADLLSHLKRTDEATAARERAAGLSESAAVRGWLREKSP